MEREWQVGDVVLIRERRSSRIVSKDKACWNYFYQGQHTIVHVGKRAAVLDNGRHFFLGNGFIIGFYGWSVVLATDELLTIYKKQCEQQESSKNNAELRKSLRLEAYNLLEQLQMEIGYFSRSSFDCLEKIIEMTTALLSEIEEERAARSNSQEEDK